MKIEMEGKELFVHFFQFCAISYRSLERKCPGLITKFFCKVKSKQSWLKM